MVCVRVCVCVYVCVCVRAFVCHVQMTYENSQFSTLRPQALVDKEQEQHLEANNFREQMALYKDLRQQHTKQVRWLVLACLSSLPPEVCFEALYKYAVVVFTVCREGPRVETHAWWWRGGDIQRQTGRQAGRRGVYLLTQVWWKR